MEITLKFDNHDLENNPKLINFSNNTKGEYKICIEGLERSFMIIGYDETAYASPGWFSSRNHFESRVHLREILSSIVPKEQLDAEEAVEKAKASLEAAQKVLESVKGKNN